MLFIISQENMALGKTVFEDQKWRGKENWTGENAVDGRYTDRSAFGGQCVISENKAQKATWRVDLGGVVSISHIDIYYRRENGMKYMNFIKKITGYTMYQKLALSKVEKMKTTTFPSCTLDQFA